MCLNETHHPPLLRATPTSCATPPPTTLLAAVPLTPQNTRGASGPSPLPLSLGNLSLLPLRAAPKSKADAPPIPLLFPLPLRPPLSRTLLRPLTRPSLVCRPKGCTCPIWRPSLILTAWLPVFRPLRLFLLQLPQSSMHVRLVCRCWIFA